MEWLRRSAARSTVIAMLAISIFPARTSAGVELLKNLNTRPVPKSSEARFLGAAGGNAIFAALTPGEDRYALWQTDGSVSGTATITGPKLNTASLQAIGVNGRVIFSALDSVNAVHPWATDGTAPGTQVLVAGSADLTFELVRQLSSTAAIVWARSIAQGSSEVWLTDGTPAGTQALKAVGRVVLELPSMAAAGKVFFAAENPVSGVELWQSDGTTNGTRLTGDVEVGSASSAPSILGVAGNYLYFSATTSTEGRELWRVDLASNTVESFADLDPGSGASAFTGFATLTGGSFVFVRNGELWVSSGAVGNAQRLVDLNPSGDENVEIVGSVQGKVLLAASTVQEGRELWSTDGTAMGTILLEDYAPNAANTSIEAVPGLANLQLLFLSAAGAPAQAWVTDGTVTGTRHITPTVNATIGANPVMLFLAEGNSWQIARIDRLTAAMSVQSITLEQAPQSEVRLGERVFFSAHTAASGVEPWVTDGTASGTRMIRDVLEQTQDGSAEIDEMTAVGDLAFFSANESGTSHDLWKTNGTPGGTVRITGSGRSVTTTKPLRLRAAGNLLYFQGNDGVHGLELWRSDGTTEGTYMVRDVNPGSGWAFDASMQSSCQTWLAVGDGRIYFAADDGTNGVELWSSDGTAAGTRRVADLEPGAASSFPCQLYFYNGLLYFTARSAGEAVAKLFRSDGTAAGPLALKEMNPVIYTPGVSHGFTGYANRLYFVYEDANQSGQLWSTNGSAAETIALIDSSNFAGSSVTGIAGVLDGALIFSMVHAGSAKLYRTAGTSSTTTMLGESIDVDAAGVTTAGRLFFGCGAVCVTDGTSSGTRSLYDYDAGLPAVRALAVLNGTVYFPFRSATSVVQLWKTDGNSSGTVQVTNFAAAVANGLHGAPVIAGGRPVFAATDAEHGTELWVITSASPLAANDSSIAIGGSPVSVNVAENDTDADGRINPLSVRIVQAPVHGSATVDLTGAIRYTAGAGYSGSDALRYRVSDDAGFESTDAELAIAVTAPPSPPPVIVVEEKKGGGGALRYMELLALLIFFAIRATSSRRARV